MIRIPVETPQAAYDVIVDRGCIERAGDRVGCKPFVVTTAPVWRQQGERLERGLASRGFIRILMPDGETYKRLSTVGTLAEELLANRADRSSLVVAFGGGVVNDVAGFLAAVYMRGIDVIQIPTTLLAQVDAAIGGKTGVNLSEGKNLVGAFHQPRVVLIDPAALDTLPDREYRAGLYEVIKCAVIASPALFELLRARRDEVLRRVPLVVDELITESVRIKARVVSADERESDLRRILNFGHTLGHALEAETDYQRLLHGEAVAFGMRAAVTLAEKAGVLPPTEAVAIRSLISAYGPIPNLARIDAASLVARLGSDKKTVGGKVHFVLPEKIGCTRIVSDVDPKLIRAAAEEALAASV